MNHKALYKYSYFPMSIDFILRLISAISWKFGFINIWVFAIGQIIVIPLVVFLIISIKKFTNDEDLGLEINTTTANDLFIFLLILILSSFAFVLCPYPGLIIKIILFILVFVIYGFYTLGIFLNSLIRIRINNNAIPTSQELPTNIFTIIESFTSYEYPLYLKREELGFTNSLFNVVDSDRIYIMNIEEYNYFYSIYGTVLDSQHVLCFILLNNIETASDQFKIDLLNNCSLFCNKDNRYLIGVIKDENILFEYYQTDLSNICFDKILATDEEFYANLLSFIKTSTMKILKLKTIKQIFRDDFLDGLAKDDFLGWILNSFRTTLINANYIEIFYLILKSMEYLIHLQALITFAAYLQNNPAELDNMRDYLESPVSGTWLALGLKYSDLCEHIDIQDLYDCRLSEEAKDSLKKIYSIYNIPFNVKRPTIANLFECVVMVRNKTIGHGVITYYVAEGLILPMATLCKFCLEYLSSKNIQISNQEQLNIQIGSHDIKTPFPLIIEETTEILLISSYTKHDIEYINYSTGEVNRHGKKTIHTLPALS